MKIRGTPSHIAEKYVALARDALSSGDPVLAENYLQHAEHYNRIILTYREQQMSQGGMDPFQNGMARTHALQHDGGDSDELADEDAGDLGGQPQPVVAGATPDQTQQGFAQPQAQPRNFDQPYRNEHRQRHEGDRFNNHRHDRGDGRRFDRNDRGDRDYRGDRNERFDRGQGNGDNRYRDDRRQYGQGEGNYQGEGNGFRRRDRYQGSNGHQNNIERELAQSGYQPTPALANAAPPAPVQAERPAAPAQPAAPPPAAANEQEQPAFLRRPVRRPRQQEPAAPAAAPESTPTDESK